MVEPCRRLGKNSEINNFLEKTKKIVIEEDKTHTPLFATILNNLGTEIFDSGNYEKAWVYFIESHVIIKNTYGKKSPYYEYSLENLKNIYEHLGNKEKIRKITEELYNGK